MKGGKDMKKTFSFEEQEDKYVIIDGQNEIFMINKDTLKIDGKKLYETFFESYSIGDTININKGKTINEKDKLSVAIYDTFKKIIEDIVLKIEEMKED